MGNICFTKAKGLFGYFKEPMISAVICGFNEIKHLRRSLPIFCANIDKVYYFDLGSEDGSCEYAKSFLNCEVISIRREETVEIVHAKYVKYLNGDWFLFPDPDEIYPIELLLIIKKTIDQDEGLIGLISADLNFYFKGKRLKGTRWGGIKTRGVAFNKNRIMLSEDVHRSKSLLDEFKGCKISDLPIEHYWMSSYRQLVAKHIRYLKHEGQSRFRNGIMLTKTELYLSPLRSFVDCFLIKQGWKDGFTGLFLSFFWTWYNTVANIRTYKYAKNINNNH